MFNINKNLPFIEFVIMALRVKDRKTEWMIPILSIKFDTIEKCVKTLTRIWFLRSVNEKKIILKDAITI